MRQVGHLDPTFIQVMNEVQELLRYAWQTDNQFTLPISGTGSAAMEAAIANLVEPGDVVLVGVIGYFGERLAEMARRNPERNYLGIEVHRPGVGQLLRMLDEYGCENVRVMRHDAVEVLNGMLPPASVQGIYLFFPDPWHKKRHHKRRILSAAFVAELARVIKPGGFFHAATDWQDYAEQMMDVLSTTPAFVNRVGNRRYSERPDDRPLTKFERRGQRLGHGVWDLVFDRCE